MITQKQYDAIVKLDSLINVKVWDAKERRFILRLYMNCINSNMPLTRSEHAVLMSLARRYAPPPQVRGVHPLRITVRTKSGIKTYTYWQSWIQKKKKKVRVGCFPFTQKGLELANEMCNKKREKILENA